MKNIISQLTLDPHFIASAMLPLGLLIGVVCAFIL